MALPCKPICRKASKTVEILIYCDNIYSSHYFELLFKLRKIEFFINSTSSEISTSSTESDSRASQGATTKHSLSCWAEDYFVDIGSTSLVLG